MNDVIALLEMLMRQASELADEFSDEEMARILQIFQDAIELIQEQAQQQQPIETPAEEMKLTPGAFPSSNINAFRFDPEKKQLLIQFHGPYPKAAGPVYSYTDVPEFLFKVLERGAVGPKTSGQNQYHRWIKGVTPSLGAAVNALIKAGGFAYNRIA